MVYCLLMWRVRQRKKAFGFIGSLVVVLVMGGVSWAVTGTGVFQGFIHHIAQQITRDKVDFAVAESCTSWFYEQLRKSPAGSPGVQRLSSSVADEKPDSNACAGRYPGIDEARAAFAQSQSVLSLSLTFYQLALVADRDDDERYDAGELRDILESLNMVLLHDDRPLQLLTKLNGKFDDVRESRAFTMLTDSMQVLYSKGYRFTDVDQAAMDRVTGAS